MPSILPKFSDQKTGSRRVVGWHKKSEKYFGFILAAKPRLRWVPEELLNFFATYPRSGLLNKLKRCEKMGGLKA